MKLLLPGLFTSLVASRSIILLCMTYPPFCVVGVSPFTSGFIIINGGSEWNAVGGAELSSLSVPLS